MRPRTVRQEWTPGEKAFVLRGFLAELEAEAERFRALAEILTKRG